MFRILTVCITVVSLILITGCQSNYLNQPASPLQITTEAKLTPKITVGEKIQATATVHKLLFFFSWGPGTFAEGVNYGNNVPETSVSSSILGDTIAEAKAAAAYKACTLNKADFIVCPRYYTTTTNYFFYRKTKARVFGYRGILEGIEKNATQTNAVQAIELTTPIRIAEPIQIAQPVKVVLPKTAKKSTSKMVQLVKLAEPIHIIADSIQPANVVLPEAQPVPVTAQLDRSAK